MLGEFFTIVVGVLVALFVDGLREERIQQEYERQILEAVMADLDANLDDLAQAQQSAEYRARTVSELLLRAEAEIRPIRCGGPRLRSEYRWAGGPGSLRIIRAHSRSGRPAGRPPVLQQGRGVA